MIQMFRGGPAAIPAARQAGYNFVHSVQTGGVAWFAHIGGFVAGLILALPWIGKARQIQWRVRYR